MSELSPWEIVSQVYELLGKCSRDDLTAASRVVQDNRELKRALVALARVKATLEGRIESGAYSRSTGRGRRTETSDRSSKRKKPDPPATTSSEEAGTTKAGHQLLKTQRRTVLNVGNNKEVFPSATALAQSLNALGLDVNFRGRDGRNRTLEKFLNALERLPDKARTKRLEAWLATLASDQTRGWIEVIRGSSR